MPRTDSRKTVAAAVAPLATTTLLTGLAASKKGVSTTVELEDGIAVGIVDDH